MIDPDIKKTILKKLARGPARAGDLIPGIHGSDRELDRTLQSLRKVKR